MKNKLKLLIKDGLKKKMGTKWFKIINIVLAIMIAALLNIDTIIESFGGDFSEGLNIYVIDKTNKFYDPLKYSYDNFDETLSSLNLNSTIVKADKSYDELKQDIIDKKDNDIILTIDYKNGKYTTDITSYKYVDAINIQVLTSILNDIKTNLVISESNLTSEEIERLYSNIEINRTYLSEDLDEDKEMMETIGGFLIPLFIMPFFFLIIMITQMIGAEINEEKTSKSMEIIISSVSPKVHFLAKLITTNIYAIVQLLLFISYIAVGLTIRTLVSGKAIVDSFGDKATSMISSLMDSGMISNIVSCLPFIIVMIILSFVAYTLLAGILASMTTSHEDFSQLQTPMMMLIMAGYFLAILASTYEKSVFITGISMVPFISCILSPVLLILGQVGIVEVTVSLVLLILTIFLLIRYGTRIYKVGILNYSSKDLWKKMFKSIRES